MHGSLELQSLHDADGRSPPHGEPLGHSHVPALAKKGSYLKHCVSQSWCPPCGRELNPADDVVENRGLYRVFVSRLCQKGFTHYSATIAQLNLLGGLERDG